MQLEGQKREDKIEDRIENEKENETNTLTPSLDFSNPLDALISRCLKFLAPPERLTVSQWAERYRIMTAEETSRPGPWTNEAVPYLKALMDAFNDDRIEKITFLKPTQVGATEAGINIIGYIISQAPCRILYVLPDEDVMRDFSSRRLQKVLVSNECFKGKYQEDSKDLLLTFTGGFCKFGNAKSAAKLASWSVPVIILDEIDKYPRQSGGEASPLKLAEERTKNWPAGRRKMFFWSTPTYKTGHIWKQWEASDVRYEYRLPCPHCGEMLPLEWQQVKFDATKDATAARDEAYYECAKCKGKITDVDKPAMLVKGEWFPLNQSDKPPRAVGFKLNSLYSPWVSFGQMAAEFLKSKDNPLDLMNFVNSWLGEPWEIRSAVLDADLVLQHKTDCPIGIVPDWAKMLTGGVDVQKDHLYWQIDAWGAGCTSQRVAYGKCLSWVELDDIMNTVFPDALGRPKMQVNVYGVDTGFRTHEVYDYCEARKGIAIPVKGSSTPMAGRLSASNIDRKDDFNRRPLQLWTINTDAYKDEIAYRLGLPIGKGSWMLNADCTREYAEHITAEQKVVDSKGGKMVETWKEKASGRPNHWLDCSVYSYAVADLTHMRLIQDEGDPVIPLTVPGPGIERPKFTI